MNIIKKIKTWYKGELILPSNDPDSPIVRLSPGHYKRPFPATIICSLIKFWLKHWKWVITTILAIIGLVISLSIINTTKYANRPYVIFDAISIHKDGGAMEYLEKIEVEVTGQTWKNVNPEEKHDDQLEITITPKQYLAHAPLIEHLGGLRNMIIYDGKRGTKYQWVYTVLVRPPYGGDIKTQKFRLEILR